MNQFKRVQIIILSTNYSTINLYNNQLIYSKDHSGSSKLNCQHLYIISDDEIKEGDWFISAGFIHQCYKSHKIDVEFKTKKNSVYCGINTFWDKELCKKIIATTDLSLSPQAWISSVGYLSLPQPSQQFIEKYIQAYNKDEIITDVLVEYKPFVMTGGYSIITDDVVKNKNNWFYEPKVNPKDNTITIKKLKDNWNREEIIKLIEQYSICKNVTQSYRNQWIKENL